MRDLYSADATYILHPFTTYQQRSDIIPLTHGKGSLLFDEQGKAYIDAIASWWVNLHGHAHPYINEKITAQLHQLEHVIFSGFTHAPAVTLAERIIGHLGKPFHQLFYSDNGSTSIEVALKMAVQFWKNKNENRKVFIAFENAYHGDTFGAMSVSERDVFTQPFSEHLFEVISIPVPTSENIQQVEQELKTIIAEQKVAAFIFEPLVQGAGGMRMYEAALLDQLIALCKQNNVLTIADEVMTGFYHTGNMFAIQQLQQSPDFICLSKGLTGGYLPLGITAFSIEIANAFHSSETAHTFYHGHSYTANPISCTAANASLDLIEKEETQQAIHHIQEMHQQMISTFSSHPMVNNVRIKGVILAMDIVSQHADYFYNDPIKIKLYRAFIEQGILIRPLGNVLYIMPPYCITDEELTKVYQGILTVLNSLLHE